MNHGLVMMELGLVLRGDVRLPRLVDCGILSLKHELLSSANPICKGLCLYIIKQYCCDLNSDTHEQSPVPDTSLFVLSY